ncbi:hypothetical protein ACN5LS_004306 [Cronobacter sakazakii]|nr:hypothetical protein [Cronobacter sakazakii]
MTIDRILSIIAIIVSFTAVPVSGYLSYRYAIKGEKRKEFNSVTDRLRIKFREQLRLLEQNIYPAGGMLAVDDAEIESLLDVSDIRDREKIVIAWRFYQNSLKKAGSFNEYNDYQMHDAMSVKDAIESLMPFITRR